MTDRKEAEARERRQLVTRRVVRHVLREMGSHGGETARMRRSLGRSIAEETPAATLDEYLDALDAAGIRSVHVESAKGDRFVFMGENLLEVTPGFAVPTCHITLGYVEGALAKLHQKPVLGSDIACQSRGHAQCRFVVNLR